MFYRDQKNELKKIAMRKVSYLLKAFLLLFLLWALPGESASQSQSIQKDIETLKKMEYDWLMAEFRMDTAFIAPMMDERFMAAGLTGVSNKQQELEGIFKHMSERSKNGHVVDSLYLDDMRVEIFDNTAIVIFTSVTKGRIRDVPFANRRTRMYDVWIKRNDQWKAVSSQVIPIK
jgi:hypothetical protein